MQAAAASADKEEEDRIGDGDGKVSDVEYDDWQVRAVLDRHTVDLIVRGGTSGAATQYCSSSAFTTRVDITSLVTARLRALDPNNPFTFAPNAANVPVTGLDTDTVKQQMTDIAVPFFRTALEPAG